MAKDIKVKSPDNPRSWILLLLSYTHLTVVYCSKLIGFIEREQVNISLCYVDIMGQGSYYLCVDVKISDKIKINW